MDLAVVLAFLMSFVTLAMACPTGFFQENQKCRRCRPACGGGQITKSNCTATSDMTCICEKGKFWETALVYCKICKQCNEGEIIQKNCTHYQNRECVQCKEGTYAISQFKCVPCSRCKEGEVVIKKCSSSQNTICKSYHVTHLTDVPLTEFGPSGADTQKRNSSGPTSIASNSNLVYICIIVVMGILIFVLVICCLSQKYKNKQTRSPKSASLSSVGSEQETFIINKETIPAVTHDPGILVRNLNPEVVISLSRLLNPPGLKNWTRVAAALGFEQIDIRNFDIHKDQCFQNMIEAWGTSRDATVYKLYQVFISIDRDDCAQILEEVLRGNEVV